MLGQLFHHLLTSNQGEVARVAQGLINADGSAEETPEFLAAFQARIDAEKKIGPNDPMPMGYRKTLLRRISQHGALVAVDIERH